MRRQHCEQGVYLACLPASLPTPQQHPSTHLEDVERPILPPLHRPAAAAAKDSSSSAALLLLPRLHRPHACGQEEIQLAVAAGQVGALP